MRCPFSSCRWVFLAGLAASILFLSACSSKEWGSWTSPTLSEVRTELRDLSFDDYVDTSYRLYLLRFPQRITDRGLAEALGIRNDRLDDYFPSYLKETEAIEREALAGLLRFDRDELAPEQQVTYDAAVWMWRDLVARQDLEFSGLSLGTDEDSPHMRLYLRLSAAWRLQTEEDIADYIACLHQAGRQIDQIRSALLRQTREGIVPPAEILDRVLVQLAPLRITETFSKSVYLPPKIVSGHHPFYVMLRARALAILPVERLERAAYLREAMTALEAEVIPAYERLYKAVVGLLGQVRSGIVTVSQYPGGDDYYAWSLRHVAGTDLAAAETHRGAADAVVRIQEEIRALEATLDTPSGWNLSEIFASAEWGGGTPEGEVLEAEYQNLMARALQASRQVFDRVVGGDVDVVLADIEQGYVPAPLGIETPARLVVDAYGLQPSFDLPTRVHQEVYPGRHLQLELARDMDLSLVQTEGDFSGFVDGWAAYAQQLAAEIGLYLGDPYGNLGRLRSQLRHAALAAVDTGIHALGWSYEAAMDYYVGATGDTVDEASLRVKASISRPGAATAAYVGSAALLALRSLAEDSLGAAFDLATFHESILGQGIVPLSVLETIARADLALPLLP